MDTNQYVKKKATGNARLLSQEYNIEYATAIKMTSRLWEGARAAILNRVSAEEWQKLSGADKALICTEIIKALMDKKKVLGFLNNETRTLC